MIKTRFDVPEAGFVLSLSLSSLSSFEGGGAGGAKQSPRYCTTLGCRACCIRVISRAMYFSTSYSVLGKTSLMATCSHSRVLGSADPTCCEKVRDSPRCPSTRPCRRCRTTLCLCGATSCKTPQALSATAGSHKVPACRLTVHPRGLHNGSYRIALVLLRAP